MSEFFFKCPHCGAKLSAEDSMIGMLLPCPDCGNTVVPRKPNFYEKQMATAQNQQKNNIKIDTETDDGQQRSTLSWGIIGAGAILILAIITLVVYCTSPKGEHYHYLAVALPVAIFLYAFLIFILFLIKRGVQRISQFKKYDTETDDEQKIPTHPWAKAVNIIATLTLILGTIGAISAANAMPGHTEDYILFFLTLELLGAFFLFLLAWFVQQMYISNKLQRIQIKLLTKLCDKE